MLHVHHLVVVVVLCLSGSARAYKNYTVGDSLGWFDNLEKADVDYQKWASDKEFSLGDFLSKFIFLTLFLPLPLGLFLFLF